MAYYHIRWEDLRSMQLQHFPDNTYMLYAFVHNAILLLLEKLEADFFR